MNTIATLKFAASLLAVAVANAAFAGNAAEYQLVIIEPWDDTYMFSFSAVSGINNNNEVTGGATLNAQGDGAPFRWTLETGKVVADIAGAINDNGIVAEGNLMQLPDGTLVEFTEIFGASDINNNMVIVGPKITCFFGSDAKVWTEKLGAQSLFQDYGVWAGFASEAINNNNEIVGVRSWTNECGDLEAFYFNLNTLEHIDIHAELIGTAMGITEAFDINDDGFVVGEGPNNGTTGPFLWHRDHGFTFIPAAPDSVPMDTHFDSINNHKVAVGGARTNTGDGWHAIIWDELRGTRDLNDLVERPDNFTIDRAHKVNDNGWIIAAGRYGPWSPGTAVVLIPIAVAGDLDANGALTAEDRAMFCAAIGSSASDPNFLEGADLNQDGVIDHLDLALLNDILPPCGGDVVNSDTFAPPADGVTNAADLAYLLGAWANQPSCADFVSNRTFQPPPDGKVDGADLAFLLGAWGACE